MGFTMSAVFRIEPFVYKKALLRGPEYAGALRPPEFAQLHLKALCIRTSIPLGLTSPLLTVLRARASLSGFPRSLMPPTSSTYSRPSYFPLPRSRVHLTYNLLEIRLTEPCCLC
jgi:hypothetical protein